MWMVLMVLMVMMVLMNFKLQTALTVLPATQRLEHTVFIFVNLIIQIVQAKLTRRLRSQRGERHGRQAMVRVLHR
jgi:hypothetical protein